MRISRFTRDRLSIEEIKCEGEQERADIILAQHHFVCHFSQILSSRANICLSMVSSIVSFGAFFNGLFHIRTFRVFYVSVFCRAVGFSRSRHNSRLPEFGVYRSSKSMIRYFWHLFIFSNVRDFWYLLFRSNNRCHLTMKKIANCTSSHLILATTLITATRNSIEISRSTFEWNISENSIIYICAKKWNLSRNSIVL